MKKSTLTLLGLGAGTAAVYLFAKSKSDSEGGGEGIETPDVLPPVNVQPPTEPIEQVSPEPPDVRTPGIWQPPGAPPASTFPGGQAPVQTLPFPGLPQGPSVPQVPTAPPVPMPLGPTPPETPVFTIPTPGGGGIPVPLPVSLPPQLPTAPPVRIPQPKPVPAPVVTRPAPSPKPPPQPSPPAQPAPVPVELVPDQSSLAGRVAVMLYQSGDGPARNPALLSEYKQSVGLKDPTLYGPGTAKSLMMREIVPPTPWDWPSNKKKARKDLRDNLLYKSRIDGARSAFWTEAAAKL